ncbi:MAG TPA: hypothetical protein VGB14_00430 [Acidimicrobiales bacterium]|jgi:hypothetical protein
MADRYSAATLTSAAPALDTPFFEFRNGASVVAKIHELIVTLGAATATNVELHRATAQGTGGSNAPTLGAANKENPNIANSGLTGVFSNAFTAAPTFTAASRLRRQALPAAIGAGLHWVFPEGLDVPRSTSVILVTPVIAGAAQIFTTVVWSEIQA